MSRVYMNDIYSDFYNELSNLTNKEILIYHTYLNIIRCFGHIPEKAMKKEDLDIAKQVEYKIDLKKHHGRAIE